MDQKCQHSFIAQDVLRGKHFRATLWKVHYDYCSVDIFFAIAFGNICNKTSINEIVIMFWLCIIFGIYTKLKKC